MPELQILGKYQILEEIGAGAFATVYRARDMMLGRIVALKLLKTALIADETAFARFTREAQVTAGLFHPYIATVLDMDQVEARCFLVMRYVDGVSLDKLLAQRGPLLWNEALAITEQIASALDFAHTRGLIHRDVKPQNIIVGKEEGAVLTDFGIVKTAQSTGLTTHTGVLFGTPAYIPPEIWQGQEARPQSDQYALACVVYEMLNGQVLFAGDTPPAVMTRHMLTGPTLPDKWPPGVPGGLTAVLAQALAKEPSARFESISAFTRALRESQLTLARVTQPIGATEPLQGLTPAANNPAGIEWVEFPAGGFLSGTRHVLVHKPFLIGKYPVMQAQYQRFIDANPDYAAPPNWDQKMRKHPLSLSNFPVVLVSWNDAMAFCKWAGCWLPTELEWEKGPRGTDGRIYPWGMDWVDGKYCNSKEAGVGGPTPVNDFPEGVSPYGVWDMVGNVWEWTASNYEVRGTYVVRGGGWGYAEMYMRVAYRGGRMSDFYSHDIGFRCALSLGQ